MLFNSCPGHNIIRNIDKNLIRMVQQQITFHLSSSSPHIEDNDEKMEPVTILLIFLLIAIILVYLVSVLLVLIRRVKKLFISANKKYFLMILIYISIKIIICVILLIPILAGISAEWEDLKPSYIEIMLKNSIILGDLCVIELFLIALEYYLSLSLSAILEVSIKIHSRFLSTTLKILQVGILLALVIPIILFDIDSLNYTLINNLAIACNSLVIASFLATFFYLNFMMTGIMFESKLNAVVKRVYKILLIILISRIVMLTIQILIDDFIGNQSFSQYITHEEGSENYYVVYGVVFVFTLLIILLGEGLPVMYSLRSNVVEALKHEVVTQQNLNQQSLISSEDQSNVQSLTKDLNQPFLDFQSDSPPALGLKKFTHLKDLPIPPSSQEETNKIWILKRGIYNKEQFVIRIVSHEISSYIYEDIDKEINKWGTMKLCPPLLKIAIFSEGEIIHLAERYYPISLDQIVQKHWSTDQIIIKIALNIAKSIEKLHSKDIPHGMLKPSHILFEKLNDFQNVYFNGCGLHSLKKYLSLITGYSNKNLYTAIEHLKDKNNVILKPKKQSDIYSFGIILYEMISKNRQYRELTVKEVQSKFSDQNIRPKMPESVHPTLKNLIRRCWSEFIEKRPRIEEVIESLESLIEN